MRRVLADLVPLDRQWHKVATADAPLHVQAVSENAMKVWSEQIDCAGPEIGVQVRAFVTGEPVEGEYVGTAATPNGVAWHLYRR